MSRNKAKKILEDRDLEIDLSQIHKFCQKFHITSLKLFGSIISENFTDSSDIDLLVEFEPSFIPGLFKFIEIQDKLSELFSNRKVDLRTKNDLSRYFRQEVLNQAVEIFG